MNDAGVLAKFLPDFARVEGMSLFNLYHNYTVDEHLLKTVGFMSKIINNTLSQPHPFTSNFNAKLDNKKSPASLLFFSMILVREGSKIIVFWDPK